MNQDHGNSQGRSVLWKEASKRLAPLNGSQGQENFEHRVIIY